MAEMSKGLLSSTGLMQWLFVLLLTVAQPGCERKEVQTAGQTEQLSGKLVVFHAGSLTVPFRQLADEFSRLHPKVRVLLEIAGSRECARKVCDLGKHCDVLASADGKVIENLLMPEYANWYIEFATNEMVLVCREGLLEGLTLETLPARLLHTRAMGRADPDFDPCGYRTLMVWQLMEAYYNMPGLYQSLLEICPKSKTRPKETDLLALLESGQLDYFFIYRSVAEQHGLEYLVLPDQVNLSEPSFADLYAGATVQVTGKKPGTTITRSGQPIVYGITVLRNAENPELGESFVRFLLSGKGRGIMNDNGHGQLANAVPDDSSAAMVLLSGASGDDRSGS